MTQQRNSEAPAVTMDAVVAQVRHGEEGVLLDPGRPIARVIPLPAQAAQRIPGLNRGAMSVDETVDTPLLDAFWVGEPCNDGDAYDTNHRT